jgi:hypothetical protein
MQCIRANIPITIVEGGTFDKTFQWKSGDPATPVDLTGYSAEMHVRKKLKDETTLLDLDYHPDEWIPDGDSGIYIYDGEEVPADLGKYRIYVKDEDSLGICEEHKDITGVYDLFLYSPEGEAVLQQYGVATIIAAVTRNE